MKRTQIVIILAGFLLVQVCQGWNHPNFCGDGSEDHPHPSSTTPASKKKNGSSNACDCSLKSTLVSASSASAEDSSLTSDIARQLYDRYQAGDQIGQLELTTVPEAVQARLENLSLTFEDLPGIIQRAVLWDSGFAITSDNRTVQVWTIEDRLMADIAVSADELEAAGCEALSCTASNDGAVQIYSSCSQGPAQMLAASKCVVEAFESDDRSSTTMWSTSSNSSTTPTIRVDKNAGTTDCGCEYTIYSIQTADSDTQTTTGECPVGDWSGSLAIPCYGNDSIPDAVKSGLTTPKGTDWVTRWILEHTKSSTTSESSAPSQGSASATTGSGKESDGGFNLWWLLLILLIILLLIIATIVACRHCHRLSRFNSPPDNTTYIFVGGRMWAVQDENHGRGAGYWLRFANWCRKTFNLFE